MGRSDPLSLACAKLTAHACTTDGDRPLGPPYSVNSAAYEAVLSPYFEYVFPFERLSPAALTSSRPHTRRKIYSQAPGKSAEGHVKRENMSVWRRK